MSQRADRFEPSHLWIGLSALVSAGGCLFGAVEGIPCDVDEQCPTSYFCDIPRQECRAVRDASSAPELVIEKVRDPTGNEVRSPFVPVEKTSRLGMLVENRGLERAENLALTFAPLACFSFVVDEATVPAELAGGDVVSIGVDVTPASGCEGLHIVDWFLTWSGRETRGAIDANVIRASTGSP